MDKGKRYELKLTEFDIKILLECLGAHQNRQYDQGLSTKATQNLMEKVYRAMGVRLD